MNRSKEVVNGIALSFIYKIIGVGISYTLVPLMLSILDYERYGIWQTMISITNWLSFFDIGIGSGLKNRLVESLGQQDKHKSRALISTAYSVISVITLGLLFVTFILFISIDWKVFYNTAIIENTELAIFSLVFIGCAILNFLFSLVNQVFYAMQKSSWVGLAILFSQLLMLALVILFKNNITNLIPLAFITSLPIVLINLIFTIVLFRFNPEIAPSIKYFNSYYVRSIMNIGIKIFFLQIAGLVLFTTNNMIVTIFIGPESVTPFSIINKLFNIFIVGFSMIMAPLWAAFTDAKLHNDIKWLKSTFFKLNILYLLTFLGIIIIFFIHPLLLKIWLRIDVKIDFILAALVSIYTALYIWNSIYSQYLAAVNAVSVSLVIAIINMVLYILLVILSVSFSVFNVNTMVVIMIISMLPGSFVQPIVTFANINSIKKAK